MTNDFNTLSEPLRSLAGQHCHAGAARLGAQELATRVATLTGWSSTEGRLVKTYAFTDFHQTVGFVNALAWIANREDHHPDLVVSYNRCAVAWSTHDAGGITENDVVCAAKTDALFA
jgi:4a-hydroxytetrahydrobiopterin dehydratase